jgi:hypothetical protein
MVWYFVGMDSVQIRAEMVRKGIVPGKTECIFLHSHLPGAVGCSGLAVAVVVEHRRASKDVVLPACASHKETYEADHRFSVVSFDALRHEASVT